MSIPWIPPRDLQGLQISNTRTMTTLRGGSPRPSHTPSIFPHSFCIPQGTNRACHSHNNKARLCHRSCSVIYPPYPSPTLDSLPAYQPLPNRKHSPSHPAGQMLVHEWAGFSHGIHSTGTIAHNYLLIHHQLNH